MRYVVYSKEESVNQDEPMFWSNNEGWTTLEGATHYSEYQTKNMNLPIGDSEWVSLELAGKIQEDYEKRA